MPFITIESLKQIIPLLRTLPILYYPMLTSPNGYGVIKSVISQI